MDFITLRLAFVTSKIGRFKVSQIYTSPYTTYQNPASRLPPNASDHQNKSSMSSDFSHIQDIDISFKKSYSHFEYYRALSLNQPTAQPYPSGVNDEKICRKAWTVKASQGLLCPVEAFVLHPLDSKG
jgi:hypothetical protein